MMIFFNQALKEILRLYPPVVATARAMPKEEPMVLDGVTLSPGAEVKQGLALWLMRV